jgi:hypothetical protein
VADLDLGPDPCLHRVGKGNVHRFHLRNLLPRDSLTMTNIAGSLSGEALRQSTRRSVEGRERPSGSCLTWRPDRRFDRDDLGAATSWCVLSAGTGTAGVAAVAPRPDCLQPADQPSLPPSGSNFSDTELMQ